MAGKSIKKTSKGISGHSSKRQKTPSAASFKRQTGKSALRPRAVKVAEQKVTRKKTAKKKAVSGKVARPRTGHSPDTLSGDALQKASMRAKSLSARSKKLRDVMLERRGKLMKEIQGQLGQTLTEEQQRRFESAMDTGDQASLDLERELDISLQEKRNRERQMIDESLESLKEGTYGVCIECGTHINEKRLAVMPFTRRCIECQTEMALLETIERSEQRH